MEHRMSRMTQMEIAEAIAAKRAVIVPTGATEAHGPHMPTDTDTHQAEHIAVLLAERLGWLVAPPLAYGISKTFEYFPGTISLSIPTYQTMLFEVGAALVKQGFEHLIILNGNRPNGTANDAVARHLVDELDADSHLQGLCGELLGAGRGADPRTPEIGAGRHGSRLRIRDLFPARHPSGAGQDGAAEGAHYGPVGWDLVAPTNPTRTYARRPRPEAGHAAIFGDPTPATAEAGKAFISATVDALADTFRNLQGSYQQRT